MAAGNWSQGIYTVKNPEKYIGNTKPRYRSSWEMRIMMFLDENKHILKWASESIAIPYKNPLTGKISRYVPDFFIMYENKYHKTIAEVIEVKPKSQTTLQEAKSRHDKLAAIVNQAKFAAAQIYCKQQGFVFRVISEDSIFHNSTSTTRKRKR
jgi:hypothetical protein